MLLNFDFDGVIVDSLDHLTALAVQAQRFVRAGRKPTPNDFRTIENLTLENIGRSIGLSDDQARQFANRIYALQDTEWNMKVFPRVVPILLQLSTRHTLTIISSSQTNSVFKMIRAAGFESAISMVLGGEMGLTKAERIERALQSFHCDPDNAMMIGDAASDLKQGKLAGVRTVAVTWGFQSRERLLQEQPEFIIDSPDQLVEIVN